MHGHACHQEPDTRAGGVFGDAELVAADVLRHSVLGVACCVWVGIPHRECPSYLSR